MSTELRDEESSEQQSHNSFEDSEEEEDLEFPILTTLVAGLWTCLFAVFTFGFDMDPDSCVVSN